MPASIPQMQPAGTSAATPVRSGAPSSPLATPPATARTGKSGCGCGSTGASVATGAGSAPPFPGGLSGGSAPMLRPAAGGVGAVATTWHNDRRITALWSINENRNAWASVSDVGWMKLSTASDSAIEALTLLTAHARVQQSSVSLRQEDDGMMHEIYVW